MNRAFLEWGRTKVGKTKEPVLCTLPGTNKYVIDIRKEGHSVIVFADQTLHIIGSYGKSGFTPFEVCMNTNDILHLTVIP